jgi:tryptophanyl-tRNA synthetase
VPEVCELTWLIGTLTPMGLLERAHSYKDKTAKGISPNFGLFAYPVLMAADILLYDTHVVPVGKDQKQHLEMTRDIAIKFNATYGETFVVPESGNPRGRGRGARPRRAEDVQELWQHDRDLWRREGAAEKDHGHRHGQPHAGRAEARRRQESCDPAAAACGAGGGGADYEQRLRAGGLGYGDLKKALFEHYWNHFAPYRAKRAELAANPDYVEQVLREGAAKARATAGVVLKRARKACGLE